ncbi:glycosyltransferase [Candidatus Poribacteria bacterium]|nr:glycosyltransferase [Candidatus Poribacteria bacterium]
MRKVLFIAGYIPPLVGPGSQRPAKFARHLPKHGWHPMMLSLKIDERIFSIGYDRSADLSYLDGSEIFRTGMLNIFAPYQKISWWLRRRKKASAQDKSKAEGSSSPVPTRNPVIAKINHLIDRLLFFPDEGIGWLPFAVWTGWKIIRHRDVDVFYTTSPLNTAHLVGYILKRLTGKPWIADFRDPWDYKTLYNHQFTRPRFMLSLGHFLERRIITTADGVITVTKKMTEIFRQRFPEERASKFQTIMNGYAAEDFTSRPTDQKLRESEFTIVYTGSLSQSTQSPSHFFTAIKQLIDEGRIPADAIRLLLMGHSSVQIAPLIKTFQLNDVIKTKGYQPRHLALEYQRQADLLFFIPGPFDFMVTGKLCEYLMSGTPIFALSKENVEAAEIIRRTNTGVIVPPDDVKRIVEVIEELYRQFQSGGIAYQPIQSEIQKFEAKQLTQQLATILNKLIYTTAQRDTRTHK